MKAIILLFALVLTLLASTQAVYVPTLPSCTNYYSGVNQTCSDNNSQCLGDSFCAEDRCIPKQIFIGQQCAHHYECYRGFSDPNENPAIYCDKTDNKCKFAKEVKETCQKNIECQSNRCVSGVCVRVKAGDACKQQSDCKPFDGELLGCHPIDEKCIALPTIGEQCLGGQCDSSSWCVNNTCVSLDYKKEGDSCTINDDIPSDICRPIHDGSSGTYMKCIDKVCTYPPRLRESCTGSYSCVAAYAEYCGSDYDTCQKRECYSYDGCEAGQFCDCTNNVCMSKTYGNMVHECSYVDGLRAPQATAFTKCLKEKCPDTIYTSSSIMLNTKSCPYQKCRPQYKENVRCLSDAGKEYGAEGVYFFGVSSASLSGLSPMIAVLLIIFNVAFMF